MLTLLRFRRRWPLACLALSLVTGPWRALPLADALFVAACALCGVVLLNLYVLCAIHDTRGSQDGHADRR